MKYEVVVYGSVLYETDDQLIAGAIAHNYREIWGPNVKVVEKRR